jgi:cytochrome oxidase assembly protein ShyY1
MQKPPEKEDYYGLKVMAVVFFGMLFTLACTVALGFWVVSRFTW